MQYAMPLDPQLRTVFVVSPRRFSALLKAEMNRTDDFVSTATLGKFGQD
jgi:hypothetical protein